uniref:SFRICE_002376 n=1 Tax=Spodoptera frugiperda TaxID=7108 RepID=A0A2H1VWG6_SPOFR
MWREFRRSLSFMTSFRWRCFTRYCGVILLLRYKCVPGLFGVRNLEVVGESEIGKIRINKTQALFHYHVPDAYRRRVVSVSPPPESSTAVMDETRRPFPDPDRSTHCPLISTVDKTAFVYQPAFR